MIYAPIIIPTLCRSDHFIRTIESLKRNGWAKYTTIYISLDYPPSQKYTDGWNEICRYIEDGDFSDFADFIVIKQSKNKGWVYNMLYLCDFISEKYDRWIYLEDDNVVSENFIEYIDKCLERYENDNSIYGVCGFTYPIKWDISDDATCLKQNINASVWGIGLWRHKYIKMRDYISSDLLLDNIHCCIKNGRHTMMIDATLRDYIPAALSPMRSMHRFMRVWTDMSMRAFLAVENKYCISPVKSKVRNIGFDGTGSGCQKTNVFSNAVTAGTYDYNNQPIDENSCFELVEDKKCSESENFKRLNEFDYIPDSQMKHIRRTIWICEKLSVAIARLYVAIFAFPVDFTRRALKKILA